MKSLGILVISLLWTALSSPLLWAEDLSRYRDFQMGMDLPAIARQAQMNPSQAKVIHQRPALIQELEWSPQPLGPSPRPEAAKEVTFSFYNGELFRITIYYDRYKTEGLTAEDLIEAISASYGTATKPAAGIVLSSIYDANESVKVLARWEDSKYSFNLVHSSYQPSFALVVLSKPLDALAEAAIIEARRLDKQEAPQREIERRNREEEENRIRQEKARLVNKPSFRP